MPPPDPLPIVQEALQASFSPLVVLAGFTAASSSSSSVLAARPRAKALDRHRELPLPLPSRLARSRWAEPASWLLFSFGHRQFSRLAPRGRSRELPLPSLPLGGSFAPSQTLPPIVRGPYRPSSSTGCSRCQALFFVRRAAVPGCSPPWQAREAAPGALLFLSRRAGHLSLEGFSSFPLPW